METRDVAKLPVVQRWLYWIKERDSIRVARLAKRPKPWTDDEILQSYRFCNVRRMDDKVSQWLMKNWYTPHNSYKFMLQAVATARFINLPATLSRITEVVFNGGRAFPCDVLTKMLRGYRDKGNTIFNGAYVVRGNNGIDKIDSVINYYVKPLAHIDYSTDSIEQAWKAVYESYGMGSFMAGQVTADLRHAVRGKWSDRGMWAPMGPGSKRGMNRLLERPIDGKMHQEEFLTNLLKHIDIAKHHLPHVITQRLEAIDWQNTLCEFDKYERCLHGQGKPKQKYAGVL